MFRMSSAPLFFAALRFSTLVAAAASAAAAFAPLAQQRERRPHMVQKEAR